MNKKILFPTALLLWMLPVLTAWEISIDPVKFDKALTFSGVQDKVRQKGSLDGVNGKFEYKFTVPQDAWYQILLSGGVYHYEITVDDQYVFRTANTKTAGNFFLKKGEHVLTVKRTLWFLKFNNLKKITVRTAPPGLLNRVNIRIGNPFVRNAILRKGDDFLLDITAGNLAAPATLKVEVVNAATNRKADEYQIAVPAGNKLIRQRLKIPCSESGRFYARFVINGKRMSNNDLPHEYFYVIDTSPVARSNAPLRRELVKEIDCVKTSPDYVSGGKTEIVNKPFGSYRETGSLGFLPFRRNKPSSWYAYKFKAPEKYVLYQVEVDYPDDEMRVQCVAVRTEEDKAYPPSDGADCGGEFALSNRMQTLSIFIRPSGSEMRVVVMNVKDKLQAAASKIRIYRIKDGVEPMDIPISDKTRRFGNWYEEGRSIKHAYGGFKSKGSGIDNFIQYTENWADMISYFGGNMLWHTLSVYQVSLYPATFNIMFGGRFSDDYAAITLLVAEKYGMSCIFDFQPEARDLMPLDGRPNDYFLVSKDGKTTMKYPRMYVNPIHPATKAWYNGMLLEFAERYKDYKQFDGVSIRTWTWMNFGLNNFRDINWGYGDYTISKFSTDTGIKIPVAGDDPQRFGKRYQWLMKHKRKAWIEWRCKAIADNMAELADALRKIRKDLKLYLFVDDTMREKGLAAEALKGIPGVQMVVGATYGRNPIKPYIRDGFVQAMMNKVCALQGQALFRHSQCYFEDPEGVMFPKDLGYGPKTKWKWLSGTVNPAGRNYLERWSLSLALHDAVMLADGGNAYTVGQPVLREFTNEYCRLPATPFKVCADAVDPVTVRGLETGNKYLFYVVNTLSSPVKVKITFKSVSGLERLAAGGKLSVKPLELDLKGFQLMTFKADRGTRINKVTVDIPAAVTKRIGDQVAWLKKLNASSGRYRLNGGQRRNLNNMTREIDQLWRKGHLTRIRLLLETAMMKRLFKACKSYPPEYENYPIAN